MLPGNVKIVICGVPARAFQGRMPNRGIGQLSLCLYIIVFLIYSDIIFAGAKWVTTALDILFELMRDIEMVLVLPFVEKHLHNNRYNQYHRQQMLLLLKHLHQIAFL